MSRYLKETPLKTSDPFGEECYPDSLMLAKLSENTKEICKHQGVKFHIGTTFSIDTIVAQFSYIDEILDMGCNVIEMETAAAFRAAAIINKKIAALFSVSDNTIQKKSLVIGRTENEMNYRKEVRRKVFPKIIRSTFAR